MIFWSLFFLLEAPGPSTRNLHVNFPQGVIFGFCIPSRQSYDKDKLEIAMNSRSSLYSILSFRHGTMGQSRWEWAKGYQKPFWKSCYTTYPPSPYFLWGQVHHKIQNIASIYATTSNKSTQSHQKPLHKNIEHIHTKASKTSTQAHQTISTRKHQPSLYKNIKQIHTKASNKSIHNQQNILHQNLKHFRTNTSNNSTKKPQTHLHKKAQKLSTRKHQTNP